MKTNTVTVSKEEYAVLKALLTQSKKEEAKKKKDEAKGEKYEKEQKEKDKFFRKVEPFYNKIGTRADRLDNCSDDLYRDPAETPAELAKDIDAFQKIIGKMQQNLDDASLTVLALKELTHDA